MSYPRRSLDLKVRPRVRNVRSEPSSSSQVPLASDAMATIVTNEKTGFWYVLLGFSTDPHGVVRAAVCGREGRIEFFNASELVVTEIDGQTPQTMGSRQGYR